MRIWTRIKGISGLLLLLIAGAFVEYLIVVYATSIGVKDETLLQLQKLPGTDWNLPFAVSPLFHLVPAAVVITLVATWSYLSRRILIKPVEATKVKPRQPRNKEREHKINLFKARSTKAIVRSASVVLAVFVVLILVISLLAYPRLIYQSISNLYQNNPSFLDFVRGTGEAVASVGSAFSAINNALLAAAPGLRDFGSSLGNLIQPLAGLDDPGKYLVFQNIAAWITAFIALLYGEYGQKHYRYKRR